jgi:PPOX class probable F420-dependent enzyme
MLDLATEFGRTVASRLKNEAVIWLTTVTPKGVPQPNPVWFYWDGEKILIYSQPTSYRIRNMQHNPMVSLNLQGVDVLGEGVVVMVGEAKLVFGYQQMHPLYEAKYAKYLAEIAQTTENMVADYSVEITIRPSRLRGPS